ncbi:hypothetical protein B2G71_18380 [Novosphingobium sp. PC22D]|uniref:EF-hand domain-containing protein n=1 Tax=Novosphingobium sp. PC22D TaxID=1962403 RepID=UPI000BF0C7AB|nr:EF-hand domain-containing protein [Novosphingobium sp. PC22D]PEQ11252.1 hypothetical protein B2G71_18380 [Novosphingobium sp. PC22D]
MNRVLLGAFTALLFVAAGLFWWQGRAEMETGAPPPIPAPGEETDEPDTLPSADVADMIGPQPPEATKLTREERRFARYDRDLDGRITRNEMLSSRTGAFRKLDKDGNNLLTFEEWAHTTVDKFAEADANKDLWLSRAEFLTTAPPPPKPKPKCSC